MWVSAYCANASRISLVVMSPNDNAAMHSATSSGRFLWLIALERTLRGLLLLAAGIYLLAKSGANFGDIANHIARRLELDPRRPFIRHIVDNANNDVQQTVGLAISGGGGRKLDDLDANGNYVFDPGLT